MKQRLYDIFMLGLDTVLPPRCVVTGGIVDRQGMLAPELWARLDFIDAPLCDTCGFPFGFEVESTALCGACLESPPLYATARAAVKYNDESKQIVLRFKHSDQMHIVRIFVPHMVAAGREMLARADVLIPVPLHPWRLFRRRYNQSALIAQALSKETSLPAALNLLLRTRATPPQARLGMKARYKNVKSAFAVPPEKAGALAGQIVVLIDDVYTTGATVQECTKALLKAGAKEVHVLTYARVVKE